MEPKKVVGIAVVALLSVGLVFWLGHHLGVSSNPTEKIKELQKTLDEERQAHRDAIKDREDTHKKEISDKNTEIERRENEYKRVLAEKESDIEKLNRMVDKLEGLYRTRTVVCIVLGTAVVVALFVGTLMGAKGRRDALRVCKERNTPAEEVV